MKKLIALMLLGWCFSAHAVVDLYFCKCDLPDADSRCVPGNNNNVGSAASPKLTIANLAATFKVTTAPANFYLCSGGAWNGESTRYLTNATASAANKISIKSYLPSWLPPGTSGTLTSATSTSATNSSANWTTNYAGYYLVVKDSRGAPDYVKIASNTTTTLTLAQNTTGTYFRHYTPVAGTPYTIVPPLPKYNVEDVANGNGYGFNFEKQGDAVPMGGYSVSGISFNGSKAGVPITGINGVSNTVTVTAVGHGIAMQATQNIVVSGASIACFNGRFPITVIDADHFSYSAPGCSGSPSNASYLKYATAAVSQYTAQSHIDVDSVLIEGFGNGFQCDGGYTTTSSSGDMMGRFITLTNSVISHNVQLGYGGGCSQATIQHNLFDRNGTDSRDHSIYLYDPHWPTNPAPPTASVTIRDNVFLNSSYLSNGGCVGVVLVVHGIKTGLQIINNRIWEQQVPTNGGCWGIAVDAGYPKPSGYSHEAFNDVLVAGNQVIDTSIGFSFDLCQGCRAVDNVYASGFLGAVGIRMRSKYFSPLDGDDAVPSNFTAANNLLKFTNAGDNARGIVIADNENGANRMQGGHKIYSNLVDFDNSTALTACFDRVYSNSGYNLGVTAASPAVATWYDHHFSPGQAFFFSAGAPQPLLNNVLYYVLAGGTADTFTFSTTPGGQAVNTTQASTSSTKVQTNGVVFSASVPDVTYVHHGLVADQQIRFAVSSGGSMPGGINAGQWYYVLSTNLTADGFRFSETKGGSAKQASSVGVGMVSATRATAVQLFAGMNNNLCHFTGTLGSFDSAAGSLVNWLTYSGLDGASIYGNGVSTSDPKLPAPTAPAFDMTPQAGSAAFNTGHATESSAFAIFGCRRASSGTAPDIGAYESACSTNKIPAAPTGVLVQ